MHVLVFYRLFLGLSECPSSVPERVRLEILLTHLLTEHNHAQEIRIESTKNLQALEAAATSLTLMLGGIG